MYSTIYKTILIYVSIEIRDEIKIFLSLTFNKIKKNKILKLSDLKLVK